MATKFTATLAALALSTALTTSAMAFPQYRVDLQDTSGAGGPANSTTYYTLGSGPTSTGPITFDNYTFSINLNSNFQGSSTLGTLSQSFTFSGSLEGTNRNFLSTVNIVDNSDPNTALKFQLPLLTGGGYSLVSDSSNTANSSITAGSTQVSSRVDNTQVNNVANPFIGGGNSPTATIAVPPGAGGYTLTNTINFAGIVANGNAGLSGINAAATSSVQATVADVPEPASLALLGAGLVGAGLLRRRAK